MKKLLLLLSVFISTNVLAQIKMLSGSVIDSESKLIAGASIHFLNTNILAVTNAEGKFTIAAIPGTYILHASAAGFAATNTQIVIGQEETEIKLVLQPITRQLDEVLVTAQKREEVIQGLPFSITALNGRQIEEYRLWNSKEITAIVPNLYAADPGDKRNVTSLRGITSTSYEQAVATYVDGVNQFGLDTYIPQLFDIERLEILRGPQGTLYGRNTMGGVINIITKKPIDKTEGFAEINIGNYGQQRYSAGFRLPLIKKKLFLGAAGLYDHMNGFYINEFNNSHYDKQSSAVGNYYLKFLPNAKWNFTLNTKHSNNRNNGPFPLVFGVNEALTNPYKLAQNATTKLVDNTLNSSLSVVHMGNAFQFNSQTAYQSNYRYYTNPIDADFSPLDALSIINNYGNDWNKVHVVTQEFGIRSTTLNNSFQWSAGSYLFNQKNPVKQTTHFGEDAQILGLPDNNFSLINTTTGKSSGASVYGQLEYSITNKFTITGGLRYDYEQRTQRILGEYQKDPDPAFIYLPDTLAKVSFSAFSPKLSAAYTLRENNILYTTYSRGYRAGGLTSLSTDPSQPALFSFKPEYSDNIEAGVKNAFFDNRLVVNASAFYTTITNVQVPTLVLPEAITVTRNTGKLNSKGVEIELHSTLTNGLLVDYSFGYTDARYTTLKVPANGTEVNLKGSRQLFTPEMTSMLALQYSYKFQTKHAASIIIRSEWKYLGTQYFDLANTIKQSAFSQFNARAGFIIQKTSLMVWGRNISDKNYISYAYDFGAVHLGNPRTYGITLAKRF